MDALAVSSGKGDMVVGGDNTVRILNTVGLLR